MPDNELLHILANEGSLTIRLESLHNSIIEKVPVVDRIACAIYDEKTDLLKTFVNSTKKGQAIEGYEYELSKSQSLKKLFERRETRVIDHIADIVGHGVEHSDWLLDQDYQSSFTIPMYSAGKFVGFLFFDSCTESAFTDRVQRDLLLLGNLVIMLVTSEIAAVRSLLATAKAARDFAHLRDFETGRHLDRMAYLSRLIARHIKDKYHLSDETIEHIFLFAPLHDIGKIGVPDCIY